MTAARATLALLTVLVLVTSQARSAGAQQQPPTELTIDLAGARAVYVLDGERVFTSLIIGAPAFVNREFVERWITKVGPRDITLDLGTAQAVYVLNEWGALSSYLIGVPDFVNEAFVARWVIGDPSGPPAVPAGLSATKIDIPLWPDDIWVNWTHVPGATSYQVYHLSGGQFEFVGGSVSPGFRHEGPSLLRADTYIVSACNAIGCSGFSASVTEGADSFVASLFDTMAGFGLDEADACERVLGGAARLLVGYFFPDLTLVSRFIAPLIEDACR